MIEKTTRVLNVLQRIIKLPKLTIKFSNVEKKSIENYKKVYEYFTKPHRLKLFKNKTIGVALLNMTEYDSFDKYYKSINGKNSAAYYSRKSLKREYFFKEIDRNDFIDDMYEINTSAIFRQGKKMSEGYLNKVSKYYEKSNYRYFGVLNEHGKLVSYCNIAFYGEFALVVSLLGHKKYLNDGIMYLMLIEFHKIMFNEYTKKGYKYVMYDTFLGANDGLKKFKEKLGYRAYKVKWKWEN